MYADIYHLYAAACSFQLAIMFLHFFSPLRCSHDGVATRARGQEMHLLKQTTITFHKYTIYYYLHLVLFLLFFFFFFFKFHSTFPDQELAPLDMSVNSC